MSDLATNGGRGGFVFCQKRLDVELAEVGQGAAKRIMVPVPPRKLREPAGDEVGKPLLDRPRWIAAHDRVGRDVLCHDRTGRDHGAGADRTPRQDHGAVPNPDVMADMDMMLATPGKEFGIVALAAEIRTRAIGEMRLRRPMHRM